MPDEPRYRASRILVVDDERVVREVIRNALDRPGLYLVDAADGEEAIGLVLNEQFDLIIADKNLPGITGLDVIRRAKAVDRTVATLLITAFASRESAEEAMAIGVDDYIVKPFELSDLERKVDEAIERRARRLQLGREKARPAAARREVMVCETNRSDRDLLVDAVGLLGHRTRVVDQVAELIDALRDKRADALICDLALLDRDDASACFLRSALLVHPGVKFVAVAPERGLEGAVEAIHHGAGKVIYRPLKNTDLVADELREFLGEGGSNSG